VSPRTQAGVATTGGTPATRSLENERLSQEIRQIHQNSRKAYGSPRIHMALMAKGWQISRQRVVRLMAKLGISVGSKRKFKVTTNSGHDLPIAANVLDRSFTASEPDRAWVAGITYIWTTEGWLYLAVILDLFSRRGRGMVDGRTPALRISVERFRCCLRATGSFDFWIALSL
jgi:transposase InsO family protein